MADSVGERIKTYLVFRLRGIPLVSSCCMQMSTATSDPELERHFFLNRGRKGQKLEPKITYLWRGFANITFNI